jgi:hypothetical protein
MPWDTVPLPTSTLQQQLAEQANIAWRATGEVDSWCNQPLRATLDLEEEVGPDFRLTVKNGLASMLVSRWPVINIIGGQVSYAATLPPQWTNIPGDQMRTRTNISSPYGTSAPGADAAGPAQIDVARGYVNWFQGREAYRLQIAYTNGWPHTSLTAECTADAATISVDDVTGLAGATCFLYDGAETETLQIASVVANNPVTTMGVSVPVGPGIATLVTGPQYPHNPGIVVSAMPQVIFWATILLAAAEMMTEGANSYTIQSVRGASATTEHDQDGLRKMAHQLLKPYRRVI